MRPWQWSLLTVGSFGVGLRGLLQARLLDSSPSWEFVEVFVPGLDSNAACFRIPSVLRTRSGVLVAFAEERIKSCSDNTGSNLVFKRSFNNGKNWSQLSRAVLGGGHAFSNPNLVEVTLPDNSTALLLHYDTLNNPTPSHHGQNKQLWSLDDGKSWGSATDITSFMPPGFSGCLPGPSVGTQAADGSIYFSCHMANIAVVYRSMDAGKTWEHSEVLHQVDECSIALLANESIAVNCRTRGHTRAQLTLAANLSVIRPRFNPPGLRDANCQGSLIAVEDKLLLSNNNDILRRRLTLKQSADGGETWDAGVLITPGYSAYSQLVDLGASETGRWIGVMYERSEGRAWHLVFASSVVAGFEPGALSK